MNPLPPNRDAIERREVLRLDALAILKELADDLVGIEDLDTLLWSIAERTISKLGWVDCVIYLLDPQQSVLIQRAAFGPKSIDYRAIFKPLNIPMGQGIVGKVASTGKAMRIKDTSSIADYIEDDAIRFSELTVPILWGEHVLGVIDSEHPNRDFYQEEDQLILETLAGITATKIQNARNAKASQDLALFYECNPNPVLQVSHDREITCINDPALDYFGASSIEGSVLNRPGLQEALDRATAFGTTTWRCRKPSETSETSESLNSESDRTGEFNIVQLPSGLFNLYGSDITHFLTLQKAAEAATEAKSQFLSVMSHEIRTPLNAILGLTDLLIHMDSSRDEQLRHLAYMEFSGRHLLSLVNDILDLEKMASGKAKSSPSRLSPKELGATIVNSFSNRAKNVGLELKLDVHPNVPSHIVIDIRWLTQILNNLIGNAIKYTNSGSVCLSIATTKERAAPQNQPSQNECTLRLSVTDTGEGIPSNELRRILEPFEQINTSSHIEGTGLGLAIVQGIVHQMSGSLTIDSEVGVGSTFTVNLPCKLENTSSSPALEEENTTNSGQRMEGEESSAHPEPVESPQKPPVSVLLADDNELNRFVANKLLTRWGFTVIEAVNGAEAIKAWSDNRPDLILMDIQMPIMDGITATLKIREAEKKEGYPRTPIIALTADAEQKTYSKIQDAGLDDRIVKPFNPITLRDLIERTIQDSQR